MILEDRQWKEKPGMKRFYKGYSLTCPAAMQIYWNKRKCLLKKRVELLQDWFGTPRCPPFHCFATPIWLPYGVMCICSVLYSGVSFATCMLKLIFILNLRWKERQITDIPTLFLLWRYFFLIKLFFSYSVSVLTPV